MSDRNVRLCSRVEARVVLSVLAFVVCLSAGDELRAGSVFMKNGYVIRGPVVERSLVSFVVGWDNGKVTIHRRFVDLVVYEPGEEERLAEWERERSEEDRSVRETLAGRRVEPSTEVLPGSLEEFIQLQGREVGLAGTGTDIEAFLVDSGASGDAFVDGSRDFDLTDGADVLVGRVPRVLLGERVQSVDGSFSLHVPQGWSVRQSDEFFEVAAGTVDGLRPSLNVVGFDRGGLDWQACVDLAAEARVSALESFETASEGPCHIGRGYEAFEVLGSATANGRTLVVRQVMVADGERVWLVSTFTAGGEGDPEFAVLDESLQSFEVVSLVSH